MKKKTPMKKTVPTRIEIIYELRRHIHPSQFQACLSYRTEHLRSLLAFYTAR